MVKNARRDRKSGLVIKARVRHREDREKGIRQLLGDDYGATMTLSRNRARAHGPSIKIQPEISEHTAQPPTRLGNEGNDR